MKIANSLTLNTSRPMQEQVRVLQTQIDKLYYAMQGRISFGVGTDGENGQNVSGQFQQYTSNGVANTEDTIAHTVGSIPIGFLVLWQDKAGSFYQGPTTGTAWTDSNIYLKCSVASVTALLFLIKQGATS